MSRYFPPESPFKMAKLNFTNHTKWPQLRAAEGCDHPEFFPDPNPILKDGLHLSKSLLKVSPRSLLSVQRVWTCLLEGLRILRNSVWKRNWEACEVKVCNILYTESRFSIPHSMTSVNSLFSVHTLYSKHSRVYSWEHNHQQLCMINCKKKILFSCNDIFEHIHPVPNYLDALSFSPTSIQNTLQ